MSQCLCSETRPPRVSRTDKGWPDRSELLDLDLGITLPVPLRTLILFTPLFLKHYDLLVAPVADNGGRYGRGSIRLGRGASSHDQSLYLNLGSLFRLYRRNPDLLARLDRKLFAACFYDRVTHYSVIPRSALWDVPTAEKPKLYRKDRRTSTRDLAGASINFEMPYQG